MKVFLCHQSESKPFVRTLAHELDKVGITSWVDDAEIGPGESLVKRIAEGIYEECDALIASISRRALNSRWVQEELDHGKYVEITKPGFQLIVILLEDVDPEDLPRYLHNKKHILWEQDRPSDPQFPHPGYGRIIVQLFKQGGTLERDDAAQDVGRLLDRFLNLLYVYGGQREITQRLGFADLMVFGEIRRDFSNASILAWEKYSALPDEPLVQAVGDLISGAINADVALKDWAMGYSDTQFQESVIADFLRSLKHTESLLGTTEVGDSVQRRIALQRDASMASLYSLSETRVKTRLEWAVDIGGQLHRFGLYDHSAPSEEMVRRLQPLVDSAERDPYSAWRSGAWPYPAT